MGCASQVPFFFFLESIILIGPSRGKKEKNYVETLEAPQHRSF
jgi:hypothetical protein